MLSISDPIRGGGSLNYYLEMALGEYYTGNGQESGRWFGAGARALGLSGPVDQAVFANLLKGRSPDGVKPLVQNAGHERRQCGWDHTFSAPKDVSTVWGCGSRPVRTVVEWSHRNAVQAALEYLQAVAGLGRRGKGGQIREKVDLIFSLFTETCSREMQPQIHTHAVLVNVGVRQDSTTGALWSHEFFLHKMAAGAIYRAQLAAELRNRAGFKIRTRAIGFDIQGVAPGLSRAFSKRRKEIEAKLSEWGDYSAVAAKKATLVTRPTKRAVPNEELTATWLGIAKDYGWSPAHAQQLLGPPQMEQASSRHLAAAIEDVASRIPLHRRTAKVLLRTAARMAIDLNANGYALRTAIGQTLPSIVREALKQIQANQHLMVQQRAPGTNSDSGAGRATDDGGTLPTQAPDRKVPKEQPQAAKVKFHGKKADRPGRTVQPSQSAINPQSPPSTTPRDQSEQARATTADQKQATLSSPAKTTDLVHQQETKKLTHGPKTTARAESGAMPRSDNIQGADNKKVGLAATPHPERANDRANHDSPPIVKPPLKTPRVVQDLAPESGIRKPQIPISPPARTPLPDKKEISPAVAVAHTPELEDRLADFARRAGVLKPGMAFEWSDRFGGLVVHSRLGPTMVRLASAPATARSGAEAAHQSRPLADRPTDRRSSTRPDVARTQANNGSKPRQRSWRQLLTEERKQELVDLVLASGVVKNAKAAYWSDALGAVVVRTSTTPTVIRVTKSLAQEQAKAKFEGGVRALTKDLPSREQDPQRLARWVGWFAERSGADSETVHEVLKEPRPESKSFLRWESQSSFRDSLSRALRELRVMVLHFAQPQPRWGSILWKKEVLVGELRIQMQRLFPQAPWFSPARRIAIPTLRLSAERSTIEKSQPSNRDDEKRDPAEKVKPAETKDRGREQSQGMDYGF